MRIKQKSTHKASIKRPTENIYKFYMRIFYKTFDIGCTYSGRCPERVHDGDVAIDTQQHQHVVAGHHGEAGGVLEYLAEHHTGAPLTIVLPDQLRQTRPEDDEQVGDDDVRDDLVDARASLAVRPQPQTHQ